LANYEDYTEMNGQQNIKKCKSTICAVYCLLECNVILFPRHSPHFCRTVLTETSEQKNKSCRRNGQWQSKVGQNSELIQSVTKVGAHWWVTTLQLATSTTLTSCGGTHCLLLLPRRKELPTRQHGVISQSVYMFS